MVKTQKTGVIRKAAQILIDGFERRFPITNTMIAAAILDPSAQHIEAVSNWLFDNNKTRSEVLCDAMQEFDIIRDYEHPDRQQEEHQNLIDNKIGNFRLMLLKKHSIFTNTDNNIEYELSNFINIKDEVADVLAFWKSQEQNFPNMARLAKVILSKPASSAKSESAFSVAGVLLCKKRALVEPLRAQKILFIHDNYQLCKSVA